MLGYVPSCEYRLVVEGELSDSIEASFKGMTLTRREGTTVLDGPVRDQAELQGLLQRVSGLGLICSRRRPSRRKRTADLSHSRTRTTPHAATTTRPSSRSRSLQICARSNGERAVPRSASTARY